MNLISVFKMFPDQQSCIDHLETLRWGEGHYCPHCGGVRVARKKENWRVGRWNCHECRNSFNVLQGTIFQGTQLPLQKWFLAIALMVNAKKSLSSCQMARDLEMNQGSCLSMQHRIRRAMASEERQFLSGIVEVDETYVGGKPRKDNNHNGDDQPKPRRRTKKTAVIGAVERGGKVVARIAEDLSAKGVLGFVKSVADTAETILVTDEYKAYGVLDRIMARVSINHSQRYVDGDVHTNTIEGFWAHLKRAWYGQHHHYSKSYMPLYIAEACWKYNHRGRADGFDSLLKGAIA